VELNSQFRPEEAIGPVRTITLSRPGKLLVQDVADLHNEGPVGTRARVIAVLVLDEDVVARRTIRIAGQTSVALSLHGVRHVRAGVHRFFATFEARYSSYVAGEVVVDPVTLAVPH
jgi:hypothetical protein